MDYKTIVSQLERARDRQEKKNLIKELNTLAKIFRQLEERQIDIHELESHTTSISYTLDSGEYSGYKISRLKSSLVQVLNKKYGLTTKGYHQGLWMVLGMSIFGMPFGTVLGFSLNNFGLFGVGLPIGMVIGMALGSQKDKKAEAAGTVLEV